MFRGCVSDVIDPLSHHFSDSDVDVGHDEERDEELDDDGLTADETLDEGAFVFDDASTTCVLVHYHPVDVVPKADYPWGYSHASCPSIAEFVAVSDRVHDGEVALKGEHGQVVRRRDDSPPENVARIPERTDDVGSQLLLRYSRMRGDESHEQKYRRGHVDDGLVGDEEVSDVP